MLTPSRPLVFKQTPTNKQNQKQNPYCCGPPKTGYPFSGSAVGNGTINSGTDIVLINGGYQPIIELVPGQWQRWRTLYSGTKYFFVANLNDPKTGQPTPNCQFAMYAKDGVFMQQVMCVCVDVGTWAF